MTATEKQITETYEIPVGDISIEQMFVPAKTGASRTDDDLIRFGNDTTDVRMSKRVSPTSKTDAALSGSTKLYEDCLALYGWEHELMMLAEETGELLQAAMKARRVEKGGDAAELEDAVDHLAEEMADVRIMLAQLSVMYEAFDMDGRIARWAEYKIDRQEQRNAKAGI